MKLTDDLKKKLEAAQTKEERDAILAEMKGGAQRAGIELEDEELEAVAGGGVRTLPDAKEEKHASLADLKARYSQ